MRNIIQRQLAIHLPKNRSAFLWGPRKAGKSHWLREKFPHSAVIDLLKTDVFAEYASRPSLLRERFENHKELIIVDEIQMVPDLLNEIHWLIENQGLRFLLTGSSARKLRKKHANLLGGRAWRFTMTPLSFTEVEGFDLESVMVSGLLPPHFLSEDPIQDLRAYVADYLKEEIAQEASVQNIPAFSEFLKVAGIMNAELLNYANVSRDVGVSPKIVRQYFQILEDTLLGFRLPPWTKVKTRRLIETEKFYLFDVGISNYLAKRTPHIGTAEFGKSFEHFILMELRAYQAYKNPDLDISYWKTSSGLEVDFILGNMTCAIEVKGSKKVHTTELKPLLILREEQKIKKSLVVCLESEPRIVNGISILPWKTFIKQLWAGELV